MAYYKCGRVYVTQNSNTAISNVGPSKIASFSTSLALPLVSLKASIVATESGSGTKSPSNPYTLGGFSNAVIYQTSGLQDYLYGVTKGTYRAVALSDLTWTTTGTANVYLGSLDSQGQFVAQSNGNTITDFASSDYPVEKVYLAGAIPNKQISKVSASDYRVIVRDDDCTSLTSFEDSLSGKYIIFKLITPVTPTITPAQFQALCTAFGITATQTTLALGQTVYGGEIVLTKKASGYGVKLRVTSELFEFDGSNDETWGKYTVNTDQTMWRTSIPERKSGELAQTGNIDSICNRFERATNTSTGRIQGKYAGALTYFDVIYNDASDLTAWRLWLASNPIYLVCELATPIEIDLTDASDIVALVGVNNVWSDTGDGVKLHYKKLVFKEVTYDI